MSPGRELNLSAGKRFVFVAPDKKAEKTVRECFSENVPRMDSFDDWHKARKKIREKTIDAVWIDCDILKTAEIKELLHNSEKNTPPIIMLCEHPEKSLKAESIKGRIFSVLKKPLLKEVLVPLLDRLDEIKKMKQEAAHFYQRYASTTLKDETTGLYNARYLEERLPAEFSRATRYVIPLSLVYIELTFAKNESDEMRTRCVRGFAHFLLKFVRANDIVVYTEGSRFLAMLPDTGKEGALVFSERLITSLKENEDDNRFGCRVTTRIGIASFPSDGAKKETGLLDLADRALKKACKSKEYTIYAFRELGEGDLKDLLQGKKR